MPQLHTLAAILPCNNLDISENFYSKLGRGKAVQTTIACYPMDKAARFI